METATDDRRPGTRPRFQHWRRQVLYGVRKVQLEAVRAGFPEAPELALPVLGDAASCRLVEVRLAAIETLERHGAEGAAVLAAVLEGEYGPPLCRRGRLRSVEALGRTGGTAELRLLVAHLGMSLEPSIRWKRKWVFNALRVTILLALFLPVQKHFLFPTFAAFCAVSGPIFDLLSRRGREREIRVLAEAIRSITERVEAAECRSLLPGLAAAGTDVMTQTAGVRRTCRELAEALEQSTAVRTLPIAAAPPASEDLPHLPLPASPQAMDPASLPRVHEDAR